jgi:hypothetical protein
MSERTLAPLGPLDWRRTCAALGSSLGLVASHTGLGLDRQAGWIGDGEACHRS